MGHGDLASVQLIAFLKLNGAIHELGSWLRCPVSLCRAISAQRPGDVQQAHGPKGLGRGRMLVTVEGELTCEGIRSSLGAAFSESIQLCMCCVG